MSLWRLTIDDFRNIAHAELDFDARYTLITGPNGSGKTSLLEALFFLSCGRSFRTTHREALIRRGTSALQLVEQFGPGAGELRRTAGVRAERTATEIRLDALPQRGFAEIALAVPTQVIDPEVHRLLEDGPSRRRRWVDWGVFHVEHHLVDVWRRYQRALRQRNAALKARQPRPAVQLWDAELAASGEIIAERRSAYLAELAPQLAETGCALLGTPLEIIHQRGWGGERTLQAALDEAWMRDQTRAATTVGPHRAELGIKVDGRAARDWVSRGQQKLVAAGMLLAQVAYRASRLPTPGAPSCLLLDDPAAELDVDNFRRLLSHIRTLPAQLIVTALTNRGLDLGDPGRMFHVEQGRFTAMV